MDPELDTEPLVRGTDPRIRIRTNMSRIPNTGLCRVSTMFTPISWHYRCLRKETYCVKTVTALDIDALFANNYCIQISETWSGTALIFLKIST